MSDHDLIPNPLGPSPSGSAPGSAPGTPPAAPSLWTAWHPLRILGLAFLLVGANFGCQVLIFNLGGGLFLPVLGGAVLGVLAPLALLSRWAGFSLRRDFDLAPPPLLTLVLSCLMALAALAPTSLLAEFSLRLHPVDPQWARILTENLPHNPWGLAVAGLAAVVAAPLAEELIFRGLVQRLAARTWGPWPAVVLSALVFGLVHGEPWYLFGLCAVGLVLGFLYQTTGSLLVCWAAHAIHNGVSLVMMYQGEGDFVTPTDLQPGDWALAGGSAAVLLVLGGILVRLRRRATRDGTPPGGSAQVPPGNGRPT